MAVDHTADDGLGRQRLSCRVVEPGGNRATHEIDSDGLDGRGSEHWERVIQAAVRCGDEELRTIGCATHCRVGGFDCREYVRARVCNAFADEGRLVQLNPSRARSGQACQQLAIGPDEFGHTAQGPETLGCLIVRLAQQQEGDRADDHWARDESGGLGLLELVYEAVAGEPERGVWADFRYEVVVVRVEPLGHLKRPALAITARNREVAGQVDTAVHIDQGCEP